MRIMRSDDYGTSGEEKIGAEREGRDSPRYLASLTPLVNQYLPRDLHAGSRQELSCS